MGTNGTKGKPAPEGATQIGGMDGSGDLQGVGISDVGGAKALKVDVIQTVGGGGGGGDASAANQVIGNASLAAIDTNTDNLDVLLSTRASTAHQVTQNGLLTTIDADTSNLDVALSTRASAANQATTNGLLTTIDADTSNLDVALSTRATAANQTTANASLASIDTKTPALGQAAMAASVPVVVANNQSTLPISGTVAPSSSATATSAGATIGVTQSVVFAANANRMGLLITNTGGTNIYIGFNASVTASAGANQGHWLKPGGSFTLQGYPRITAAVHAISDAGGGTIAAHEFMA